MVGVGSEGFDKGADVGRFDHGGLEQFLGTIKQGHHGRGRDAAGIEVGRFVYVASGKGQLEVRDQIVWSGQVVREQGDDRQAAVLKN